MTVARRNHDAVTPQKFNRRVNIQAPTYADDGQGGQAVTWTTVYACWADIPSLPRGRGLIQQFLYQQRYPQASKFIEIRYESSIHIDATMRIQYIKGAITHIYKIVGPLDDFDEDDQVIVIPVQEDQAKGIN